MTSNKSRGWDSNAWAKTAQVNSTKTTQQIFTQDTCAPELNVLNISMRESRDSALSPNSTPIVIASDDTGSMDILATAIAKTELGNTFNELLNPDRKPVTDPHLMFMAIGDEITDRYPLQASQFEINNVIVDQTQKLFIEGGGGGNGTEGYSLPWYFLALKTSIDSYEKRRKKGYYFSIGDEAAPRDLSKDTIKRIFGDSIETDKLTSKQLLEMAQRQWHVFHLIVEESSHYRMHRSQVVDSWKALLGERALLLSDHKQLASVIVSTIQVIEGQDKNTVVNSWNGSTSLVVQHALSTLQGTANTSLTNDVIRF